MSEAVPDVRAGALAVTSRSWLPRTCPNGEWLLLLVLLAEIVGFTLASPRFLSVENAFEIVRLAAEIGLLAGGLTLVIKTGGIDLSVGSMMGLAAVTLGAAWSTLGLPVWAAVTLAVALGAAGGALHGLVITRLGVPPLIATLGTFSLYRGLAEATTGGYVSYTGFPTGFLNLGQGYLGGVVPEQAVVLLVAATLLTIALHRTVWGRELTVIGHNAAGARFAGVRVASVVTRAYVICGALAALAGAIYVARIGQAKADAGLGYELTAIAAVVLGGTSIAGGAGSLPGTMLGVACLVVLQNGLRLAGQPSEMSGLLTGAILIVAIALDRWFAQRRRRAQPVPPAGPIADLAQPDQRSGLHPADPAALAGEDTAFSMKTQHVALLIAAILGGALLIAGSNLYLARSVMAVTSAARSGAGPGPGGAPAPQAAPAAERPLIALTPKAKADPYFVSCKQGADAAAAELGVDLLWDGPVDPDPARQNEIVEAWITRGVDVIAASCNSPAALSTVLRKAQQRGIKVLTWDADAEADARSFFVNQATAEGIGTTLADEAARLTGGAGDYAIVTASLTDSNQNEWIKFIKARMAAAHPRMNLVVVVPSDGQRDKALTETRNLCRAYPGVKAIIAIAAPAVPGAAEALKQEGRTDVKLTGLSVPSLCKTYVHEGWVQSFVLWNTVDLGYLTVLASHAAHTGKLAPGATSLDAGRLGALRVNGDQLLLGQPFVFTKENVDQFNF